MRMSDLAIAACKGSARLVRAALRTGAKPNARHRGRPVLHWAIQEGHLHVVKILINAGASLERRCDEGFTPLDTAVGEGNIEIVRFLLRSGAKVNGPTCNGTPLHTACAYRRLPIVQLLLQNGADASAKDRDGRKPRHSREWASFTKIKNSSQKGANAST